MYFTRNCDLTIYIHLISDYHNYINNKKAAITTNDLVNIKITIIGHYYSSTFEK